MGCGNCGSGADGKPGGCKGNGGCSSGGCNRMNVFDWLSTLPLANGAKPYNIVELSFNKGSRKDYYINNGNQLPEKGDWYAVEGVSGFDVGQVSLSGDLVKLQLKKYNIDAKTIEKKMLRKATDEDLDQYMASKNREVEMLIRARVMARNLKLEMKLCEVELQADGRKATFFYTADQRVDFRELIKVYASDFKVKVEMRQIGARQESGKVGGIGSCGRELCCSTWLSDFKSVNTAAARYQNLSINQAKLSGQCGRLKCCLNYELDTYMDALSVFPEQADTLDTVKGTATLQKRDIFKNLMWYSYRESNKQYPLSIDRVKEILRENKAGKKADELQPVEIEVSIDTGKSSVKADMGFVNDVGQISLRSLEKGNRKKKKKKSGGGKPQQNKGNGNRPQQQAQSGQPQQQGQGKQQGGGRGPQKARGNNSNNNNQGGRPPRNKDGNKPQQGGGNRNKPQGQNKGGQSSGGNDRKQNGPKGNSQGRPPRSRPKQSENNGNSPKQQ